MSDPKDIASSPVIKDAWPCDFCGGVVIWHGSRLWRRCVRCGQMRSMPQYTVEELPDTTVTKIHEMTMEHKRREHEQQGQN